MTNFFEQQKQAKAKSRKIIGAFLFFLALQIGVVYALASEGIRSLFTGSRDYWAENPPKPLFVELDETALLVSLTFAVILTVLFTFRRMSFLVQPSLLPRKMGAVQVLMNAKDPLEDQYYNIVSEMALASGVPVPEVYVLRNEMAINAFTSGYNHQNANVVVTQGALENFTRDELQAVVGHEFGHIISGDVKANINLLSMAYSFSALFTAGYYFLRLSSYSGRGRRSSKNEGGGQLIMIAFGVIILGALGSFVSRLVSSMFSRQREYLADALSVQFTRYPASLASALAKIRDKDEGSMLSGANASEVSAICFSSTLQWMSSAFDTHPPLNERIKKIDKSFLKLNSSFKVKSKKTNENSETKTVDSKASFGEKSLEYLATIGLLTEEDSSAAGAVVDAVKKSDLSEFLNSYSVEPMIYSMLLSKNPLEQKEQEKIIKEKTSADVLERLFTIKTILSKNENIQRYSLVEILAPLFSQVAVSKSAQILEVSKLLIDQDNKVMPFEAFLYLFIKKYSFGLEGDKRRASPADIVFLISVFADLNVESPDLIEGAKKAALKEYFGKDVSGETVEHGSLELVLSRISKLSLKNKERLVKALMKAVLFDEHLNREEFECFRIVCDAMEVPAPPLKMS